MKDAPSVTFELSSNNPLALAIREAVGAKPDDVIEVVTPQFTRPRGAPMPGQPPATLADWADYRTLSMDDLVSLGFGRWDDRLALIPGDWHSALPNGLELVCIDGQPAVVGRDYIDDDIRFGCLAYGIHCAETTTT